MPGEGALTWYIPDAYLPAEGSGPLTGHEAICVLNTSDERAHIAVDFFFEDREPLRALAGQGIDLAAAVEALTRLAIETPSWGYGNSGTRFAVFPWPGAARTVWEKLEDAALVHRLTGICPSVAIHIPWDRVDDWPRLVAYAKERGVRIGAVNPNVFQD